MAELRGCPFCGGSVRRVIGFGGLNFFKCHGCGAVVSFDNDYYNTHKDEVVKHLTEGQEQPMKREIYHRGIPGKKWGIWNLVMKEWQFGICEDTPMLAQARLFQKIGDDARKCRFDLRVLPVHMTRRSDKA